MNQYYQTDLFNLHYFDNSNIQETIVFLHGFTGSSRDFKLPDVISSNYRCLIPDLPGHGRTQILDEAYFTTSGQVTLLKQWLNSLGLTKFHLFGYSMGGRLALQFAVENYSQLQSLILVSTTAGIKDETARIARTEADDRIIQKLLSSNPKDFLTDWLTQPLFQGIADRGEDFMAQEVARRVPLQLSGLACSLKYFGSGIMPAVWHQLFKIKTPTLVIAGSKDEKYKTLASELVTSIPNSTVEILPTSHAPLIESPDLLWKCVLEFVRLKCDRFFGY